MPAPGVEVPVLLRRFAGVDLTTDAAFVDPAYLQSAANWVPDQSYLLTKRRGTLEYAFFGGIGRIDALRRVYDLSTNTFLFLVHTTTTGDDIYFYYNDVTGSFVLPTNSSFATLNQRYGIAQLGNFLYIGNGRDPLKRVTIVNPGSTATDLTALATTNETGAAVVVTAATATTPQLFQGTYAYAWAVYDTSTKLWISRGLPRTVQIGAGNYLNFTSPSTALAANRTYHLFVAPRNLPIEFAHDQFPDGFGPAVGSIGVNTVLVDGNAIPAASTVVRTGRFLVAHRGRVWIAGDLTNSGANKSAVYATGVIVPGLEQAVFDQGDFFPANAVINVAKSDGDEITGLGIATVTTTFNSPAAPLIIFKNFSTWAWLGDILDDDAANLVQLSGRVGCVAANTIIPTPIGLVFMGADSIYLIRPDTLVPEDIGSAINSAIRAIPRTRRAFATAVYHRGFYKLSITPAGASLNSDMWWLDLRHGLGSTPSWWGPHSGYNIGIMATGLREGVEDERCWAANDISANSSQIVLLDQPNVYTEPTLLGATPLIVSRLKTKALDLGAPFTRKLFTRARVNARTDAASTALGLQMTTDGGMPQSVPAIAIPGSTGSNWNTATWNVSSWSARGVFHEGVSQFDVDRPRGLYAELTVTHAEAVRVDLRDFELTHLPVGRVLPPG